MASDSSFDEKSLTDIASARPAKAEKLRLVVVAGPDRGKELLLEQGTYTVGKSPQCDLVLSDGAVSRKHLEFAVVGEGIQVRDLGSTNGSYIHGSKFEQILANAGAGITFELDSGSELYIEAIYHWVQTEQVAELIPVTFGIRW